MIVGLIPKWFFLSCFLFFGFISLGARLGFNGSRVNSRLVFFVLLSFFFGFISWGARLGFNGSRVNPRLVFFVLLSFFQKKVGGS